MKKSVAAFVGLCAMMIGASGSTLDGQFGLDCTGISVDGMKHTTTSFHYRMSVDMERGVFCLLPECKGLHQLGPVTDAEIGLFNHPIESNYLVGSVNRTSGAYRVAMQSSLANIYVTGMCDRTVFTPFAADAKPVHQPPPFPGDRIVATPPLPLP
jgi:hypothetical protein